MPAKRKSQEYYILTWIPWITKQTVDSLSIEMILDLFIYIIQFYINQNTFLPGFIIRKDFDKKRFSDSLSSNWKRTVYISKSPFFCIYIITWFPYRNCWKNVTYVIHLMTKVTSVLTLTVKNGCDRTSILLNTLF